MPTEAQLNAFSTRARHPYTHIWITLQTRGKDGRYSPWTVRESRTSCRPEVERTVPGTMVRRVSAGPEAAEPAAQIRTACIGWCTDPHSCHRPESGCRRSFPPDRRTPDSCFHAPTWSEPRTICTSAVSFFHLIIKLDSSDHTFHLALILCLHSKTVLTVSLLSH